MVLAAHLILDERGILSTLSKTKALIVNHLPDTPEPYPGGDDVLGGFIEWRKNLKTFE